jgi:sugar phosphate isomerase/epimerase
MTSSISLQLYTVRDALAEDFVGTLKKLAVMGFELVEPFRLGQYPELAETLAECGLGVPTAHTTFMGDRDPERVFELAASLGVETLIEPRVPVEDWMQHDAPFRLADLLNSLSERASRFGIRLGYHNHHHELVMMSGGTPALLEFAGSLEAGVVLEVDTYWAATGGVNPAELLDALGSRVIAIHLKDGPATLETSQVPLGEGTLNIPAILAAAPQALRVIEFDATDGDLFEAIERSAAFLRDASQS